MGRYAPIYMRDIMHMYNAGALMFYCHLASSLDDRKQTSTVTLSTDDLRQMLNYPENILRGDQAGAYADDPLSEEEKFEKYALDPVCHEIQLCRMLKLIPQDAGFLYIKEKTSGETTCYRFSFSTSRHWSSVR